MLQPSNRPQPKALMQNRCELQRDTLHVATWKRRKSVRGSCRTRSLLHPMGWYLIDGFWKSGETKPVEGNGSWNPIILRVLYIYSRWCRISSINSRRSISKKSHLRKSCFFELFQEYSIESKSNEKKDVGFFALPTKKAVLIVID